MSEWNEAIAAVQKWCEDRAAAAQKGAMPSDASLLRTVAFCIDDMKRPEPPLRANAI